MKDVPSIQGVPDPRRPSEINKESNIDPEKFKKILRVDESDETQKRHKRRKTKQEEEDEEIEESETDKQSVPDDFNKLLEDPKKSDSVFQPEGGRKPTVSTSDSGDESDLSPYDMISEGKTNSKNAPAEDGLVVTSSSTQKKKKKEEKKKAEEIITAIKAKKEKEEIAKYQKKKKVEKGALSQAMPPKKEEVKEKAKEMEKPKSSITLEGLEQTAPFKAEGEAFTPKKEEDEKKSEEITTFEPQTAKISPKSVEGKKEETKAEEAMVKTSELSSLGKDHEKKKKDKDDDEEKKDNASAPTPMQTPTPEITPPPINAPVPAYATLSSQIFELFERLVGLLMIQNTKGVSTTTVTLNMPGSVFHGCKIKLEHYEIAPHAYNLQMMGNPKAVELFSSNLTDLAAAFEQNKYAFSINLRKPVLSEEFRYQVRRKESASDEDSGEESQQE